MAQKRASEARRDSRLAERAAALLRASALPPGLAARSAAAAASATASAGGGLAGIGLQLGRNGHGEHVVESLRPGSAAERKLRIGDVIAGVTEVKDLCLIFWLFDIQCI